MGVTEVLTLIPAGIMFVIWIGVVVYLLMLATRLVRAVEKIADKNDS